MSKDILKKKYYVSQDFFKNNDLVLTYNCCKISRFDWEDTTKINISLWLS